MRYSETIGIVGGMGSYATLDFFRRILDASPAEKEWDRPRAVIDNHCTMPPVCGRSCIRRSGPR